MQAGQTHISSMASSSSSAPPSPMAIPADVFTAFELVRNASVAPAQVSTLSPQPAEHQAGHQASFRQAAPAAAASPSGSVAGLFSRRLNWILLGSALLVLTAAAMYYWRRKQTTIAKEKSGKLELLERRFAEEMDAVSQRQAVMEEQLKRVATHSRSVEQGLSQALESWSETTDDLAKQLGAVQELKQELAELLAEDDAEEAGAEAGGAQGQPAEEQEEPEP